jgi:hypothetical protein
MKKAKVQEEFVSGATKRGIRSGKVGSPPPLRPRRSHDNLHSGQHIAA